MHLELPIQEILDLQPGDGVALILKACTAFLSNPTGQQRTATDSLTTEYTSVVMDIVQWLFKTLALGNLIELN